ncbi:MAG: metal-dependent phosphohydrolase, partial [Thermomicrobiaceae bacterium]|nr:metal-dependent phosphohydrolase [Thermomicrobiaceae bacterium]
MNPSPTHPSENEIDRANWLVRRAASRNVVVWQAARLALFGLAILATLAVVLYLTWHSDTVSFKAGQIADRTIKAPRTATFISQIKTQERRQEAYDDARNVVLRSDPTVAPTQAAALQKALAEIDQVRAGAEPDHGRAVDRVRSAVDGLTADDAQAILALSDASWTRVKDEASGLLDAALSGQVRTEDVAQVKERLVERASLSLSSSERGLAAALAKPFIRANVEVDEDKTKAAREAAASQVAPVEVTVQQGQVIVRDGDPVSKEDIEKLEYFGLLTPSENWHRYGGTVGLLAFITLALTLYLYRFTPEVWQGRQLLLLAIVLILPLVSERFLYQNPDLRYMLPTAAAAMLIAILLDFQLAVVVGAFLAFYLGVLANESYEVASVAFLTAVAGAAVIWRAERTITFFWSGLAVAVATYAGGMLFALLSGRLDAMRAGSLAVDSAINGALSASLTFLSFSLLGRL